MYIRTPLLIGCLLGFLFSCIDAFAEYDGDQAGDDSERVSLYSSADGIVVETILKSEIRRLNEEMEFKSIDILYLKRANEELKELKSYTQNNAEKFFSAITKIKPHIEGYVYHANNDWDLKKIEDISSNIRALQIDNDILEGAEIIRSIPKFQFSFKSEIRDRRSSLSAFFDRLESEIGSKYGLPIIDTEMKSDACAYILRSVNRSTAVSSGTVEPCMRFIRSFDKYNSPELISGMMSLVVDYNNAVEDKLSKTQREYGSVSNEIENLRKGLESASKREAIIEEREISRNMIITIAITLIVFSFIMWGVTNAIIKLFRASENGNSQYPLGMAYPVFLEMITVFVLTVTILILGLANKLDNEALAALIGGISGYVLGRIKHGGERSDQVSNTDAGNTGPTRNTPAAGGPPVTPP